jgi:hypothetical protein
MASTMPPSLSVLESHELENGACGLATTLRTG